MSVTAHLTCRVCPTAPETVPVVDLGTLAVSTFHPPGEANGLIHAPLVLDRCPACTLVQLRHSVARDALYRQYWYRSGVNETMVEELRRVVVEALARVDLTVHDYVLDIGANDGTLLAQYHVILPPTHRPLRVGVDPAKNLFDQFAEHAEVGINDYFPFDSVREIGMRSWRERFKIITSIAMFYDLDDPHAFVHAVKRYLHPEGVWVVQFQDLLRMLETAAFDNICHEHLEYYSLHSLGTLLRHNDLRIYDVVPTPINGGSLRVFVGHGTPAPSWSKAAGLDRVLAQLNREDHAGLLGEEVPLAFTRLTAKISRGRQIVRALLDVVQAAGEPVDGYGASTKGNTLLQVYGLGAADIRQIAERSPEKVGLVTGGTNIPIVDEATWRSDAAPVTLVPIWQFAQAVERREREYLRRGGRFVFPLPEVRWTEQEAVT